MGRNQSARAAVLLVTAALGARKRAEPAKPAAEGGRIAAAVNADVARNMADFNAHDPAKVASHDAQRPTVTPERPATPAPFPGDVE